MRVEGSTTLQASCERVFAVFTDPDCLRRATPGVTSMTATADGAYEVVMKVGVAGITGTYNGRIALVDLEAPRHYRLNVSGEGSTGVVQGSGTFDFAEEGGATRVTYAWDVQVGGLVAGVGQRVLSGVAKMLIGQFMKSMEKELA